MQTHCFESNSHKENKYMKTYIEYIFFKKVMIYDLHLYNYIFIYRQLN